MPSVDKADKKKEGVKSKNYTFLQTSVMDGS